MAISNLFFVLKLLFFLFVCFLLLLLLLLWTIFKVFIVFVTTLLLFYVLVFGHEPSGILTPQTRD